jgi:hypothetical protein
MADQGDNRGLPFRPAQGTRSGTAAEVTPASSPRESEPQGHPRGNEVDVRTMIVGAGTAFSGQITSCNRLIVEGTLDAKLDNCDRGDTGQSRRVPQDLLRPSGRGVRPLGSRI